jgi:hypothetical protein
VERQRRRVEQAAARGTVVGAAWRPINRLGWMGQFGRTGARVGVWVVGPNPDGGGRGAQLASLGGLRRNNID